MSIPLLFMSLSKIYLLLVIFIPQFLFAIAGSREGLPENATPAQAQKYINTSEDCMIVQNKKQIVLKCGDNMIFVTSDGVGIKTSSTSKFWR